MWIVLSLTLILLSCTKAEKTVSSDSNFPPAPEFTLKDLKGNQISLSDLQGKVVFLNFWATWCGPCRYEIPGFVELYKQYKDKGLEIIGVSLDRLGSKSLFKFVEEFKINYPIVYGTQQLVNDYRPGHYIPVTIIIDKRGKIRHKHVGYLDKETFKNYFLKFQTESE